MANAPSRLLKNLSFLQGEELKYHMAKSLQWEVHKARVITWIVLEDEEALKTGQVAIMFLDSSGRVVRRRRGGVREAEQIGGFWMRYSRHGILEWDIRLGANIRICYLSACEILKRCFILEMELVK